MTFWDIMMGVGIGFLFGGAPLLSMFIVSKGKGRFFMNPDEWIRKTKQKIGDSK